MSTLSPPVVQQPSTLWVPERKGTYGPEVNGFAESIGIPRDAEQQRDIDCFASFGERGRWLTLETCHIEGRQNGKTKSCLLSLALADLFIGFGGADRVVWTSHAMKTTLDVFDYVTQLIEESAALSRRVKEIVTLPTKEAVILTNGSRMDFMARAGSKGRGLSGKRVILDEALFLRMTMLGALLPTLSSRDNPQVNYGSSAGNQESDLLRSLQARGRRGGDPSLIFVEYRAPGSWDDPGCGKGITCDHIYGNPENDVRNKRTGLFGCAMDTEDYWRMGNHAIGAGRMRVEFVRAERRALCQNPEGVLEFGRERMGWEELGGHALDPDRIPENAWAAQTDLSSSAHGSVVFGVDMDITGAHVSISVAGFRPDGNVHFGLVDYLTDTSAVAQRLLQLTSKHDTMCGVMWLPKGPIEALGVQLKTAGVSMVDVTGAAYAQACGAFKQHVINGYVFHRGSQILNSAFSSAERRVNIEGGWVFGRKTSSGDISPLVASVLAVKGLDDNGMYNPTVYVV